MKFKSFKDWSLFKKIATISIATIVLMLVCISFFVIPVIENNIMNERKAGLENVINLAYSLVEDYDGRVKQGKMTAEEAKTAVKEEIRTMRYGAGGAEYLFIVRAKDCTTVMHPIKPELEGKDQSAFKDKKGKRLFVEMVDVCEKKGYGFVDYYWPKPNTEEPVLKLSYVNKYNAWDWIIGTGVYMDDVQAVLTSIKMKIYGIILVMIAVSLLLTFYIARIISRPVKEGVRFAQRIASGDLTAHLDIRQQDEIGVLSGSLNEMVDQLKVMFSDLSENAQTLSSSSNELAAISDQLNSAAYQTSDKVGNIASAVEEMNASVNSISASAEQSLMGVDVVTAAAREMTGKISQISQDT